MIVEDGSGVFGANSYGTFEECAIYLSQRGDTTWLDLVDGPTTEAKETALINATDYIERKYATRFSGLKSFPEKYAAEATITFNANPADGDTVLIGAKTYRFVNLLSAENDILINTRISITISNFIAAVNNQTGYYHPSTTQNEDAAALVLEGRKVVLQARYNGEDGNDIKVTPTGTAITSNFDTLVGGNTLGISQPLSFPRSGVYVENVLVKGVPYGIRMATFELARRAITIDLLPDPVQDETGRIVVAKTEKVGPIEDTIRYSGFVQFENLMRMYPAADRLIRPYLGSGTGGVSR